MCRGMAILMGKDGKFYCDGISSHTETKAKGKEDECLKFEMIIDDSKKCNYALEIDEDYEKNSEQGKEARANINNLRKWVKENETELLRQLLLCSSYARSKEDQNHNFCKSKGNQYHSCCESERSQYHDNCKSKRNQYHSCCESEGDQYHNNCKSKGEFYIGLTKLTKYPNTTEIIKLAKDKWDLTFTELIRYCAENSKFVLKKLGKE